MGICVDDDTRNTKPDLSNLKFLVINLEILKNITLKFLNNPLIAYLNRNS